MTDEFERSSGDAVHETAAFGLSRSSRPPGGVLLLDSDDVDFEDIRGGDDEVGDGADFAARGGPIGVEVVGLNLRDSRDEVGSRMRDEAGGAILDARRPVHHLVRGVAHRRRRRMTTVAERL